MVTNRDNDSDDILPEQRGALPIDAQLAEREAAGAKPAGRLMRIRSWATVLVAVLALVLCTMWVMSGT